MRLIRVEPRLHDTTFVQPVIQPAVSCICSFTYASHDKNGRTALLRLEVNRLALVRLYTIHSLTRRRLHSQEYTKTHTWENAASIGKRTRGSDAGKTRWRRELQQGKPSVVYVRNSGGNIAFCLKTDIDVVTLTFWPFDAKINGFPGLKTHRGTSILYVKFGDPTCSFVGF